MSTIYAGPGKVYLGGVSLFPDGENGPVNAVLNETPSEIATAMYGKAGEQVLDQTCEITTKPFDDWSLLPALFPAFLGVTTNAGAGSILIGTRPHNPTGGSDVPAKIWTSDARLYNAVHAAITGHPSLHLGAGKSLYGDVKITGIGGTGVAMGTSGYLFAGNVITETGGVDPGGPMSFANFVRESWTGAWGTVTGFGAIQAEDEWTIENQIKYSPLKVQGRTLAYKLDSVSFMVKCKPFGPTHSQILTAVGAHTQGQRLGSADLTLTSGLSAKTITLKNAEIKGAGFLFGGTGLGTGEIGFVSFSTFSAGAMQPLIVFSA